MSVEKQEMGSDQPRPSVSPNGHPEQGASLSDGEVKISFYSGMVIGLLALLSLVTLAPDFIASVHYTCAIRTADGCVLWANKHRAERYAAGKAGTADVLWRLTDAPSPKAP